MGTDYIETCPFYFTLHLLDTRKGNAENNISVLSDFDGLVHQILNQDKRKIKGEINRF